MVPFSETEPVFFPYCTPVLYLQIRIGKIVLDWSYQRYFLLCSLSQFEFTVLHIAVAPADRNPSF
jgi:hypothetical protein